MIVLGMPPGMAPCVICGRPAVEIDARSRWGPGLRERVRLCVFCIAEIDLRHAEQQFLRAMGLRK